MLFGSLFVFTMVALMGLSMVGDAWKSRPIGAVFPRLHAAAALFGSALVIGAALDGDTRLYNNIGMAVVVILLGVYMGFRAHKGKPIPKAILIAHAGLAVACYLLLGYYALNK
ncbi:MAG: hypothetical protein HOP36_02065 [Methyloglobulus sp.]|nr:hypothetical protein [Methyloglobulus sp.]